MHLTGVRLGGRPDLPLLVLGPALGTGVAALWSACARHLSRDSQVVGWDLPGHGTNTVPQDPDTGPITIEALAAAVVALVDQMAPAGPGERPMPFYYAGVGVGGAVGLQILLDAPARITGATLLCTGARIGTPQRWRDRAEQVRVGGTAADEEYAAVCEALAGFDVRERLAEVASPVLAVAGADDVATPTSGLAEIAEAVADGRLVVLDHVAHLAPLEAPDVVARLVRDHALGRPIESVDEPDLSADLEELAGDVASGGVWSRPGLDRRSRSLVVLAAAVARGDHEELATQLRAARSNGLSVEEVKEALLQAAVQCDPADADAVLRVAWRVLEEPRET